MVAKPSIFRRMARGAVLLAVAALPALAPAPARAWWVRGGWGWVPGPLPVRPAPVVVPPGPVALAPAPPYRPVWVPGHLNRRGRWVPGHWR